MGRIVTGPGAGRGRRHRDRRSRDDSPHARDPPERREACLVLPYRRSWRANRRWHMPTRQGSGPGAAPFPYYTRFRARDNGVCAPTGAHQPVAAGLRRR